MALTITVTTPLNDDDRRVLHALMGTTVLSAVSGPVGATLPAGESVAAAQATALTPASTTEAAAGAEGTGLDSAGLPWDEQIHSSNRKQNADGSWQRRRGVQDATYDARVAELRAMMGGNTSDMTEVGTVQPVPSAADVFNQSVDSAAATLVPPPPAPPAPPAPADAANDWDGQPGFLRVMKLITAKKLPAERLNALLVDVGLAPTTTSLLKADGATRETFAALLDGEG